MSLLRYALLRLLSGALLVVASATAIFLMMRLLGNPIAIALSGRVSEEEIAARTEAAGLNRPLLDQLLEYLGQLASGTLGKTTITSQEIDSQLWTYLPASLEFGVLVILFAVLVAVPLGYRTARHPDRVSSFLLRVSSIAIYAAPIFLSALILKIVFTIWIPLFPVSGRVSVASQIALEVSSPNTGFILFDAVSSGSWQVAIDYLLHMALPVLSIGLVYASSLLRAVRSTVIEQIGSDWYLEARNKFGDDQGTIFRHLFRPALASIITSLGTQVIVVLSGMIFAETVFEIRGLGFLITSAVISRDYNLVQSLIVVIAVLVIAVNLVTDLVSAAIDPRFRKLVR